MADLVGIISRIINQFSPFEPVKKGFNILWIFIQNFCSICRVYYRIGSKQFIYFFIIRHMYCACRCG